MKHKTITFLVILVLLSTHTPLAFAQSSATNNWSAVQQLRTNERLVVKQKNGKELKGRMIEASDSTLTIDRDGKPVAIARTDVRQVDVIEGKAAKGKWALIGAGIGTGVGGGIGAAKYRSDRDDYDIYIHMGLLIGAGAGAVGGMLFGQSKRKRVMVYSAI